MPVSRKFSPPLYTYPVPPLSLLFLNKAPNLVLQEGSPNLKQGMRAKAKARRRALSPRALDAGDGEKEMGEEVRGAAHRARKKSYKPPDVRTIFEEQTQDPRVPKENGEGHTFILNCTSLDWCDVCCKYIIQDGLVCTGKNCV